MGISSTAFAGERERTCAKAAVIGGAAGYYSTSPTAPPEEKRKNAETWAGAAYATCYVTYPH
ncbi:MAG: hypothetical protein ACRDI1_10290 [Actinomycetota bacterium]